MYVYEDYNRIIIKKETMKGCDREDDGKEAEADRKYENDEGQRSKSKSRKRGRDEDDDDQLEATVDRKSDSNGTMLDDTHISEFEAILYDRSIRTWGISVQQRLRKANVLFIGVTGMTSEVCKHIILAGVNSVTIISDKNVSSEDLSANFFLRMDDIGKNIAIAFGQRICEINSLVKVVTLDDCQRNILSHPVSFFSTFSFVFCSGYSLEDLVSINRQCRESDVPFIAARCFGHISYVFSDLQKHEFTKDVRTIENDEIKKERYAHRKRIKIESSISKMEFLPLSECLKYSYQKYLPRNAKKCVRHFCFIQGLELFFKKFGRFPNNDDLKDFKICFQSFLEETRNVPRDHVSFLMEDQFISERLNCTNYEISSVTTILGGIVGQEIVKVISKKGVPLKNFLFFDECIEEANIIDITSSTAAIVS